MKKYIYNVVFIVGATTKDMTINSVIFASTTPMTTEKQFNELIVFLKTNNYIGNIVVLNMQLIEEREIDKPMTNFERIKAMTVEELAKFLSTPCDCEVDPEKEGFVTCGNSGCIRKLKLWLES